MYRLEYSPTQEAYHVAHISEPKKEGWDTILDNSTRDKIDEEYNRIIKSKKYSKTSEKVDRIFDTAINSFCKKISQ